MGSLHKWGVNPFQDFLLRSIMYDADISDKELEADIHATFIFILQNIIRNRKDVIYLDFEIKNNDDHFSIIGKNAISAVWLSGEFPIKIEQVLSKNIFIIGNRKYKYNNKTNKLTYTIIDN